MRIQKQNFGSHNGQNIYLFVLTNQNRVEVKITNYGGIVTSLLVPDKKGQLDDVVLGFDSLEKYTSVDYMNNCPFLGALIGRYANRIANGKFVLDGKEYKLAKNNGPNSLHGGNIGFDKVVWQAEELTGENSVGVVLKYHCADMEEGFPGNLDVTVTYRLTQDNELEIEYEGTIDKACPVTLTQHSYFNLNGVKNSVLEHQIMINADYYTPVDENSIPDGTIEKAENTAFDFKKAEKIGNKITGMGNGYDHNYVLNKKTPGSLTLAAKVSDPASGRIMEMYTTEPGVQFYTGNYLDGTYKRKEGLVFHKHYGFCLEAQHYPDSPNKPQFPNVILHPGEKYAQTTVYKFLTV